MFNVTFNQDFGKHLVATRRSQGFTQEALAKKLRFTAQFLGRIERGTSPMPAKAFKKSIALLGMDASLVSDMAADAARRELIRLLK